MARTCRGASHLCVHRMMPTLAVMPNWFFCSVMPRRALASEMSSPISFTAAGANTPSASEPARMNITTGVETFCMRRGSHPARQIPMHSRIRPSSVTNLSSVALELMDQAALSGIRITNATSPGLIPFRNVRVTDHLEARIDRLTPMAAILGSGRWRRRWRGP